VEKLNSDDVKFLEYSAICHGDCWNNNILFKQVAENCVEVKLLDYQMMRYASPATDIWYFLLVCTTKEFRDRHFDDLIRVYYDKLSEAVKSLGSDPDKVFPREVLEAHIKRFAKFGMLMAILLLPLFTAQSADAPDLQELADKMQLSDNTADIHNQLTTAEALYSSRMVELLREMSEKEYL
jgi:Ecdysteroid kinase-like family